MKEKIRYKNMKKFIFFLLLLIIPFLQGCAALGVAASAYAIYQLIEEND